MNTGQVTNFIIILIESSEVMLFTQLKEIVCSAITSIDILISSKLKDRTRDDELFFCKSMNDNSMHGHNHNDTECINTSSLISSVTSSGSNGIDQTSTHSKDRWISWDSDETLAVSVIAIKDSAKALSNDYIKLALLLATAPSIADLIVLVDELSSCTQGFTQRYFMFLQSSYSDCLFDSITRLVRGVLHHLQELINTIQSAYIDSKAIIVCDRHCLDKINYLTGMVLSIKADIDKLPVDNRQSYRRFLLEQCLSINETYKEFKGYLDEARCKADAVHGGQSSEVDAALIEHDSNIVGKIENCKREVDNNDDGGDDDDDDDEEEELDYTDLEVKVVEQCVLLISRCVDSIKQSITVVTAINDGLSSGPNTHDTSLTTTTTTVFQQPATVALGEHCISTREYSSRWMANVVRLSIRVNTKVLDLGAELYPPFADDLQQIQAMFQALTIEVVKYIRCVISIESLRVHIHDVSAKASLVKMEQLLREVSSSEQDIIRLC